jgi:hypothetical protein
MTPMESRATCRHGRLRPGAYELGWADAYTDETANKVALTCTTNLGNVSEGHPGIDVSAWVVGCKAGNKAGQAAAKS